MPDKITGLYLSTERVSKGLVITLTPEGRDEMRGSYVLPSSLAYLDGATSDERLAEIRFTKPHLEIWTALLEDLEACRDLHMLADYEYEILGALTSAPIIVTLATFNDQDELVAFDAAFWFPNYQIESELETLLCKGAVTFDLASEPQDLNTCACGFESYIVERMHNHTCEGSTTK